MNTLNDVLHRSYVKLGDTEAGENWCLMALHPSQGPLELRGIPDADAFPSVCMDYESVVSIPPPVGATGVWKVVLDVFSHPVQPVSFYSEYNGTSALVGGVVNPTLPLTTSYTDATVQFAKLCNSYRMLYTGVTIDLDASALNDAGSVIAGQLPLESQTFNYSLPALVPGDASFGFAHILNTNYSTNFPGQTISQLPGAYMGLAKDGIYMPLKISPTAPWVTTTNANFVTFANPTTAVQPSIASLRHTQLPVVSQAPFPFYGSTYYNTPFPFKSAFAAPDQSLDGDVAVPFQQQVMGHIVFYNLNVAASLTLKVRWGVEMRIEPNSILAPALKPSARHDVLALSAYSDIAGALPWAYPSSYNADNKLLAFIKKAWNTIRPIAAAGLSAVPVPLAQVAGGVLNNLPDFERPAGTGTTVVKSTPTRKKKRNGLRPIVVKKKL